MEPEDVGVLELKNNKNQNVIFIRKNGRVIPIKNKDFKKIRKQNKMNKPDKTTQKVNKIFAGGYYGAQKGLVVGNITGAALGATAGLGTFFGAAEGAQRLSKTKAGVTTLRKLGRKGRKVAKIGGALTAIAGGLGVYSKVKSTIRERSAIKGYKKGAKKAAEQVGATIAPGGIFDPS